MKHLTVRETSDASGSFVDKPEVQKVVYQQGWVCPKCGSVYSPLYYQCTRCNDPQEFKVSF